MPKLTFLKNRIQPDDVTVEAAPGATILQVAQEHHVPLGHACGGVCACSTCHIYVKAGLGTLPDMDEDESDRLDQAFGVAASSRLGCQVRVGETDLVVEITPESIQAFINEHPELRHLG